MAKVTASGATDALTDALGSVRDTTDGTGTLTGRRSYEAFGQTLSSSGTSLAFGFTGAPSDATGLIDLRARSLDPVSGRFLSPDSVIPNAPGTQGYSPYAYVANSPVNWTDPTGHLVGLTPEAARIASEFASGLAELDTPGITTSIVAGEVACQETIGNAGLSGRTGCVDGAAVLLTTTLFNVSAWILGYAFRCAAIPGCLAVAVATYEFIHANGSSGDSNQLSGDASGAVDTLPGTPAPVAAKRWTNGVSRQPRG